MSTVPMIIGRPRPSRYDRLEIDEILLGKGREVRGSRFSVRSEGHDPTSYFIAEWLDSCHSVIFLMAGVSRFEELIAWQKSRVLVYEIYVLCRKDVISRDYGFTTQYRNAAISVMSNIAEGFERRTVRDFARFLDISIASCAEVRSQTYAALDLEYASESEFKRIQEMGNEVARLTKALRSSLDRKL